MSIQVTLTLPDEMHETAQQWATMMHSDLSETLIDALSLVLTPVLPTSELPPVSSLSDEDVASLTVAQMPTTAGVRLDELLEQRRDATLNPDDFAELMALMQLYNQLWIRQSEALAEAVKRGIREPMTSEPMTP